MINKNLFFIIAIFFAFIPNIVSAKQGDESGLQAAQAAAVPQTELQEVLSGQENSPNVQPASSQQTDTQQVTVQEEKPEIQSAQSAANLRYEQNYRQAVSQSSLLKNSDIIAYYGHPNSRNMGILGRYSIEELDKKLAETAAEYKAVSGGRDVKKAFHIIYGTVWPEAEIGILNHDTLMRYINYGIENDIMVIIDHQIGKYDPIDSLKKMLPYLQYPNVHLALDPEWRTLNPMVDIGHITAEEVNRAQQIMQDYLIENNLPGERLLIVHQFNYIMIRNRGTVRTDFERVKLIHNMDGIGHPQMKGSSYEYNARAENLPLKGFKLFYNLGIPGAGFDNPIMSPKQVYELSPRPVVIMYQ